MLPKNKSKFFLKINYLFLLALSSICIFYFFDIKHQFDTLQFVSQDIEIFSFRFGPSSYLFPELLFVKVTDHLIKNDNLQLYFLTYFQFFLIIILAINTFKFKEAIFFLIILLIFNLNNITIVNAFNYHSGLIINLLIYLNLNNKLLKKILVLISSISNGFTLIFLIFFYFFYPSKSKNSELLVSFFGYLFLVFFNETGIHLFIYSILIIIIFTFFEILNFNLFIKNFIKKNKIFILKLLFIICFIFTSESISKYLYFGTNFFLFAEKRYFALISVILLIILFHSNNDKKNINIFTNVFFSLILIFISYFKYPIYLSEINNKVTAYKCAKEYLERNNIFEINTNLWDSIHFDINSNNLLKLNTLDFKNNIPETFLTPYNKLSNNSKFAILNVEYCSNVPEDCNIKNINLPKITSFNTICNGNFDLIEYESLLNNDRELLESTNKIKQILYNLNINKMKLLGEYKR